MILVTTDAVPGQEIEKLIGLVRGSSVRGAAATEDISAWFENVVGGEIPEYTRLMAQCREQAIDRMIADAQAKGADAIVGLRFVSCEITDGAAEILAYGTAVKLRS